MRHASAIVMAALATSGLLVLPTYAADTQAAKSSIAQSTPTTKPTGELSATVHDGATALKSAANSMKQIMAPTSDAAIRGIVKNLVSDAMTKKDMTGFVSLFEPADQQRLIKSVTYANDYGDKLDGRIEKLSQLWKQKYGHDFDLNAAKDPFAGTFVSIQTGTMSHDPQLASAYKKASGDATGKTTSGVASDQEIGVVDVKASHGLSDMQVPLIRDKAGAWKLDVPSTLNADTLRQRLTSELAAVGDSASQLPADENDGYRSVAHHVLSAIYVIPAQQHAQASPTTPTIKAGSRTASAAAHPVTATHYWWQFWK